jgi:hypothetical protein
MTDLKALLKKTLLQGEVITTVKVVLKRGKEQEPDPKTEISHVGILTSFSVDENYLTLWFKHRFERVNIPLKNTVVTVI